MKIRIRYREDGRVTVTAMVPFGRKHIPVSQTSFAPDNIRQGVVDSLTAVLAEVEPMKTRVRSGASERGGTQ